jgi:hypothetical protein
MDGSKLGNECAGRLGRFENSLSDTNPASQRCDGLVGLLGVTLMLMCGFRILTMLDNLASHRVEYVTLDHRVAGSSPAGCKQSPRADPQATADL